jgi:hypothetical protein
VPRPLAILALAAAGIGLSIHAYVGFRGAYLTWGSGVWLTLARDLARDGVFIRDFVGDLGYGGTRYFPLFFAAVAMLLKAGLSAVTAGCLTGAIALSLLYSGAFRIARAAGVPLLTAMVIAAAAACQYFALQAVFEIRADVLAAALNLWGVALLLPAWSDGGRKGSPGVAAGVCFALAFATKITALAVPAGLFVAALVCGRTRAAVRLAASLTATVLVLAAVAQVASAGRAFPVWAACMFAGTGSSNTLATFLGAGYLGGLANSHLVLVMGGVAVGTLVVAPLIRLENPSRAAGAAAVPIALWVAATITLGVTLSSPGTVPSNQAIEWLAVSAVVPALVAASRPGLRRVAAFAAAILTVWMGWQNVARARERWPEISAEKRAARASFVEHVRQLPAPILSESALWPILADREVIVPDAFAARVVFRAFPDVQARLIDEITRRRFAAIIFEFDPASKEGRGMHEFAHLGRPVIAAIESQYVFEREFLPNAFVFLPRASASRVDTPRTY